MYESLIDINTLENATFLQYSINTKLFIKSFLYENIIALLQWNFIKKSFVMQVSDVDFSIRKHTTPASLKLGMPVL